MTSTRLRYLIPTLLILLILFGALLAACGAGEPIGPRPAADALGSVEAYLQRYQPGPEPRVFQTTRFYDRHGTLLAERWNEGRRTWVSLDQISPYLIEATIATEDATFYENIGIDPARIAGAALQNVQEKQIVSGASTISMQLARNLFLGPDERYDQSVDRKLAEVGLAQELTSLFSKEEVLEMYFNLLNYGHLAYGPEAAAQIYFDKSASDLTLAEATMLAGIPQRPADLDLFTDLEAAKERQAVVLSLMVRHGFLTAEQADAVYETEVVLNSAPDKTANLAPHFVQFVEDTLDAELGADATRRSGLQITTSLDLTMQQLAQTIVANKVAKLKPTYDLGNAALVALKPGNNEILAMVGSADFKDKRIDGQVNVALRPRQPGSAIKPVLYATAIEDNLISPATVLWDTPITYTISAENSYAPINYDETFHGPVTARIALANSYNVPAVKLLDGLGVERMVEGAQSLGISSFDRASDWYGLSLTLGGGEVTLIDLTTAFATFANEGRYREPVAVLEIRDSAGMLVDLIPPNPPLQAISPATAFLITDILSDNVARTPAFGENSALKLSQPAAAKTGTTNNWRDNWTVGYTQFLVAGVWAGNSDGHPMRNASGLTGAAPIWQTFMEKVLDDPDHLRTLAAPADLVAWTFTPPADVQQLVECPPGVSCRENGEYFSDAWLELAGENGPIADSIAPMPTAPVYVDSGEGGVWTAYCETEPALERALLKLPGEWGLPEPAAVITLTATLEATVQVTQTLTAAVTPEQLQALAWVLEHPTPVNLGPCDTLGERVALVQDLLPQESGQSLQVLVDLTAAMDPNAGPVAGHTAQPVASLIAPGASRFVLSRPIEHHTTCPGHYVVGEVEDRKGAPLAGIHITLVDQWGNRADTVSKSGAVDYGHYDFPINHFANRYTVTIVDESGAPLSLPIVIDHLQGSGGDAPCHTVDWVGKS